MPRTPNCRIFIGNLASECTSKSELRNIFSKYGTITEEPIIRRSFGFVQYEDEESAQKAIENENGRLIGDMKIGHFLIIPISFCSTIFSYFSCRL